MFKHFVEMLSEEKGRHEEYALYAAVARLAPKVIGEERKIYKGVSANIDFYSGFVYSMLDLPLELYTPIFAISRIAGWSCHPHRGAHQCGQDHPSCIQECQTAGGLCAFARPQIIYKTRPGAWKAPGLAIALRGMLQI